VKYNRREIATYIVSQLELHKEELQNQYNFTENAIGYFVLDDLLPVSLTTKVYKSFPNLKDTVLRKSIREYKYTAFQMDSYDALLEEVIYAFQDDSVVAKIQEICSLESVFPDENLYAGGLSLMAKDNFLNPHLDNSHDKDRNRWRVLNLLFYVTPDWELNYGGNIELWPNGIAQEKITIASKFNRLVVMATHNESWHSVSKVEVNKTRCCVSNYYFSDMPIRRTDTFHVTTFRGNPSEKVKDIILQIDNKLRTGIRKVFKKGIRENPHQFKK